MKIISHLPNILKILSLVGILLTQFFPPRQPTPIKVELPTATGTADIIADFVASLERAEESRRYPPAEPVEPTVQATPVRPEEWIRANNGQWMIKPEK